MAESELAGEARRRVNGAAVGVRSVLAGLGSRAEQVKSDGRLSDEGKAQKVAEVLDEGEAAIREAREDARASLETVLRGADARYGAAREVDPELLGRAERRLAPFLQGSMEDQRPVLGLYREHFEDRALRRALEEHAESLAVALGGGSLRTPSPAEQVFGGSWGGLFGQQQEPAGGEATGYLSPSLGSDALQDATPFRERWLALEKELAHLRPPDEQAALEERTALEELRVVYLEPVESLVDLQLEELRGNPLPQGAAVRRQLLEAQIVRYETQYGLESSDPRVAS